MTYIGIITEYNPLHNGHVHHIQSIRQRYPEGKIIAVMSGHFVQRGGPAIIDKWSRGAMAVLQGVDLVLELPLLYASQSAEIFAKGAIGVLNATGLIDVLVFGSESNDVESLKKTAWMLSNENEQYKTVLQEHLKKGISFPAARSKALSTMNHLAPSLSNDILGMEYIKQLYMTHSTIRPETILRTGTSYHSQDIVGRICSATAAREAIAGGQLSSLSTCIPTESFQILAESQHIFPEDYYQTIRSCILQQEEELQDIFEVSEGLENRILQQSLPCRDYETLVSGIKSKRYSRTRIQRLLFNILLQIKKDTMKPVLQPGDLLPYLRVLAFGQGGREVIRQMKSTAKSSLIIKTANYTPANSLEQLLFKYDLRGTRMYYAAKSLQDSIDMDFLQSPIYIK